MDNVISTELLRASLTSIRLFLAITLLLAGIKKLKNPSAFVSGVLQYQILPKSFARWYGYLLPVMEVAIGGLLLFGIWLLPIAIVATLMLTAYSGENDHWFRAMSITQTGAKRSVTG